MAGRARVWLAVGMVAVLLGVALWRQGPAAQGVAASAKAQVARAPSPSAASSDAPGARAAQRLAVAARRVKDFEDLKRRAKAGDAVAQRLLADTYESCFMVNFDREGFFKDMAVRRGLLSDPAHAAVLDETAQERSLRCDAVDGGAIIPSALIRGWYAQAAENGDLAARLTDSALSQKKLDPAESARLFEEVLASNDPAAVFAMGSTVGSNYHGAPGDPAGALMTGEQASSAWQVAACRMGYDCAPSGVLMGSVCLAINACAGDNFEDFVKKNLGSDAERGDLERRVTEILRLIEGR